MNIAEQALILNTATATTLSTIQDRAKWQLVDQIEFKGAKKVSVSVQKFTYTNWFENIFLTENVGYLNKIYYSNDPAFPTKFHLALPNGSYSVDTLQTTIAELLREAGHANIFEIGATTAANKCYFIFNAVDWFIYLNEQTPYILLGFDSESYIPADKFSSIGELILGDNVACFNYIESIKVRSNISWGIIDSVNRSNLLTEITPNVTIGSIHSYEPYNIVWTDSLALRSGMSTLEIWLEDEVGDPLPMSENWTLQIGIKAYY